MSVTLVNKRRAAGGMWRGSGELNEEMWVQTQFTAYFLSTLCKSHKNQSPLLIYSTKLISFKILGVEKILIIQRPETLCIIPKAGLAAYVARFDHFQISVYQLFDSFC